MKPLAYTLQFRGVASEEAPGTLDVHASAPSGTVRTILEPGGIRTAFEPSAGDEVVLQARIAVRDDGSFAMTGSISFGVHHAIRFRARSAGRLVPTPDRHLRQGSAVGRVDGGTGQFEDAVGRITSNFLLSDTGELTDHQVGLVFVRAADEAGGRATQLLGRELT